MMDFIGGISAATEGLKLVNELRKIDKELDKAELKLRLVDVADKLLDSKQALQDAQERESLLRKEIMELRDILAKRAKLQDSNGLLYEVDAANANVGEPYCNVCYVREDKLIRLRHHPAKVDYHSGYKCDICKTFIISGPGLPNPNPQGNRGSWTR